VIYKVNYASLLKSCKKRNTPVVEVVCADIGISFTHN